MSDEEYRKLAERLYGYGSDDGVAACAAILSLMKSRDAALSQARENAASAVTAYGQADENHQRAILAETRLARAVEALRPFAKAGELFAQREGELSDMLIYQPAAGKEYNLIGDDLRRARTVLSELEKSE